jgi:preprotein translocase subunit YajC
VNIADLILLAMLGVLIAFMFSQNRKRRKQAEELFGSLTVGDKITLHSGIIGTLTEVGESEIVIETTPKTKIRVLKQAVRAREAASTEEK